ncbi:MAG: MBL fold metallo-hydrolase [Lachnospiraceae bacterium]
MKKRKKYSSILLALVLFILCFVNSGNNAFAVNTDQAKPGLEVMFIDVGQGDAILISCDDHYMLIDGGTSDKSDLIYTVLKNKGITHLDAIAATHPHADHVGGLPGALAYAVCDVAYVPVASYDNASFNKFKTSLQSKGVPLAVPETGSKIQLGSAVISVIGPTDIEPSMTPNDISLFFRLDYGNTSFLFAGDAEQQEQQLVMWNYYDLLDVDCLKAAHHGSYNGASSAFIQAVSPKITVVSCGAGNSYGHPHADALSLYKNSGSALYRTDMHGDIYVTSDGTQLYVTTEKQPQGDIWSSGNTFSSASGSSNSGSSSTGSLTTTNQAGKTDYVLNTHTGKFHLPSCSSVSTIKESNKVYFTGTRDELINKGYSPCGRCHP